MVYPDFSAVIAVILFFLAIASWRSLARICRYLKQMANAKEKEVINLYRIANVLEKAIGDQEDEEGREPLVLPSFRSSA